MKAIHGSTAELFAAGNYAAVAMTDSPDEWQTYAAMGLIGKTQAAIEGLKGFDNEEARFYSAVASWIDGDETIAVHILEKIPTPHAQNLLALIRKPKINVLAQLPWTRRAPHDLLTAAAEDSKFKVQNISFHPQDLPNEPYADIHKYYDPKNPPDFYICQMVEWHLIPPNIQELPCPLLGQTADYDLHIQAVYPWLQVFDEMVVTDHSEWQDVRQMVSVPVSTFPKSFGVADRFPPIPSEPREIDVFLSGTVIHPYHLDKVKLLHQILQIPDIEVRFINGFVGSTAYNGLLKHSKVCFTYVRHLGSMPTRGLEALSMGCALVVQKGSVLTLYVGEEEGVLTYGPKADELASTIRRLLDQWPEFEQRAQGGAEIIRREFALPRVASQYLRFLTFLAAKPRGQRQMQPVEQLNQKRPILRKGWLPGGSAVLKKMRMHNVAWWQVRLKIDPSPRLIIDMARELTLEYATSARQVNRPLANQRLLSQILRLYRTGLALFPKSLVLRFNLIRMALHFGGPKDVSEALKLTEETLRMRVTDWQIDAMEDVFPWDLFSTFFNYRKYFDLITESLKRGKPANSTLALLILASLHYYLAHYSGSLSHFKQAVSLDPDFPFYKLHYAKQLMKRGGTGDYEMAGKLLTQLAESSILFVEAFESLEQLQAQHLFMTSKFEELADKVNRARQNGFVIEEWITETLKPREVPLAMASNPQFIKPISTISEPQISIGRNQRRKTVSKKNYLLSVIVSTSNTERSLRGLLEDLETQTIANHMEIIILDRDLPQNGREIVEEFQRFYDNIILMPTQKDENIYTAVNQGIKAAQGKYLTLAHIDDRLRPEALQRMVRVLNARPDISLVYADMAIREAKNKNLESTQVVGYYLWPEFNRHLLFQTCYIGPQSMWRSELHDRYGYFDPKFEFAGNYEFWLRIVCTEKFLHIPQVLGFSLLSPGGNKFRKSFLSNQEFERVRERHWPKAWGQRPPPKDGFFIPADLLSLAWATEARNYLSWGIFSSNEYREIEGLLAVMKSAVIRKDWTLAEVALRTSIEHFPSLLSVHLTLSKLFELKGRTKEAADILKAVLKINPYTSAILERLGSSISEWGESSRQFSERKLGNLG